jgi:hypothetical protein
MVKNTKGGSGHKGQARKHTNGPVSSKTRLSEDPSELYAYVVKKMGGAICQVICNDGKTRLCVIRGKFRGSRGKRDSFITASSWLLVGIRDWESAESDKCDLLEVYSEADKLKLRNVPGVDWSAFVRNDSLNPVSKDADDIVFADTSDKDDYERLIGASISTGSDITKNTLKMIDEEADADVEDINIDDI